MIVKLVFSAVILAQSVAIFLLVRKLLRFDGVWDDIDISLYDFEGYCVERTSKGILTDHPEVREFHERAVQIRDRMRALRGSIASVRGKGEGEWDSTSDGTSTRTSSSSALRLT